MASENGQEKCETLADIVREKRSMAAEIRANLSNVPVRRDDQLLEAEELDSEAGRIEAAARRDAEIHAMTCEANERLREHLEIALEDNKRPVGDAAAMREALVEIRDTISKWYDDDYISHGAFSVLWDLCSDALSSPARNCDRPECATSKAAQNVWRKEDGGKTPYYEWLFAPAAERKGDGDENK